MKSSFVGVGGRDEVWWGLGVGVEGLGWVVVFLGGVRGWVGRGEGEVG